MTHDKLLKKINWWKGAYVNRKNCQPCIKYLNTIRAVVELHKPVMQWSGGYDGEDNPLYAEQCSDCSGNGFTQEYPCETIRSIEKELS